MLKSDDECVPCPHPAPAPHLTHPQVSLGQPYLLVLSFVQPLRFLGRGCSVYKLFALMLCHHRLHPVFASSPLWYPVFASSPLWYPVFASSPLWYPVFASSPLWYPVFASSPLWYPVFASSPLWYPVFASSPLWYPVFASSPLWYPVFASSPLWYPVFASSPLWYPYCRRLGSSCPDSVVMTMADNSKTSWLRKHYIESWA